MAILTNVYAIYDFYKEKRKEGRCQECKSWNVERLKTYMYYIGTCGIVAGHNRRCLECGYTWKYEPPDYGHEADLGG